MSDLFHEDVPDEYIEAVVRVVLLANWHTYQVLTKCSERMRDLLGTKLRDAADEPHIWWGVSIENRRHGLPRIDHLREAPARMRFLSIEPLLEDLGLIDLGGIGWAIGAAKAALGPGRCPRIWSARSGNSAGLPVSRSSSSSGAASTRSPLAANWTGAPMTRCRSGSIARCQAWRTGVS
jgi:hypothetical protein